MSHNILEEVRRSFNVKHLAVHSSSLAFHEKGRMNLERFDGIELSDLPMDLIDVTGFVVTKLGHQCTNWPSKPRAYTRMCSPRRRLPVIGSTFFRKLQLQWLPYDLPGVWRFGRQCWNTRSVHSHRCCRRRAPGASSERAVSGV